MIYTIIFEPKAQEELDKLPSEMIKRIIDKLEIVRGNPFHFIDKTLRDGEYTNLGYRAVLKRMDEIKDELPIIKSKEVGINNG